MVVLPKMLFLNEIFLVHLAGVHASFPAIQYHEYQVSDVPMISMYQSVLYIDQLFCGEKWKNEKKRKQKSFFILYVNSNLFL